MTNTTYATDQLEAMDRLSDPFPSGFSYFLREYVWIEDRKSGHDPAPSTIRWEWWPVHNKMVADLSERLIVILKARQISWSWLLAAYRLYNAMFVPNYLYLLFSQGEDEAKESLRKSKFIYEHLPDWLRSPVTTSNQEQLTFAITNGTILVKPSTEKAGRSYTASCIEADEAAFHPYAAANYTAYKPAIDAGGQHIVVSTANGFGNMFERMYHAAKAGNSPYQCRFYPWNVRPGRDRDWLAEQRLALEAAGQGDKLQQEYPGTDEEAFLVTGRPRFNVEVIEAGIKAAWEPLKYVPPDLLHVPGLRLWKLPIPGQPYVMFSDPAEGLAHGDNSVTQVLAARTLEHVATLKGKWEPAYFTQLSSQLGRYYNLAFWGWERNNHGHVMTATINPPPGLGAGVYPVGRCYWHIDSEPSQSQYRDRKEPIKHLGFPTTPQTRGPLIDDLAVALDSYSLTSPSRSFWEECRTFVVDDKGRAAGMEGTTDDEVLAMAGARRMAMQPGASALQAAYSGPAPSLYRSRR